MGRQDGQVRRCRSAATQSRKRELREQLDHFADRVKVLERIVTDKGLSVATQIETLRDQPALKETRT